MQQSELLEILNRAHEVRVLVLGDLMLDRFVYGSVARVSPEAPIPILDVHRAVDSAGGAANVARNVASLGARTTVIGVTGEDPWARDLRAQLGRDSLIDARLLVDPSRPTTVKTRFVADGQQVMRADREIRAPLGDAVEQRLLGEFEAALTIADVVVLSDYAKGVLSEHLTQEAIQAARHAAKPVVVDPKSKDLRKYKGATVLTPNQKELQNACGFECQDDGVVERTARSFVEAQICTAMVVTRGKDGMSVVNRQDPAVHLRAMAREVFDVSGAGDTVVAAMSLALATGADIVNASTLANLAAGIVVGKVGTAVVTASELIEELSPPGTRGGPGKIFTLDSVLSLTRGWRDQGLRIAFTNGGFDLLHPGHVSLLDQAKRGSDRLIVGLNSDESLRRLKGPDRPIQNEIARATILAALKFVDAVVIFSEDTPIELIKALQPDVLVKGANYRLDQVVGAEFVLNRGGRVVLADVVEGHSTTSMVHHAAGLLGS